MTNNHVVGHEKERRDYQLVKNLQNRKSRLCNWLTGTILVPTYRATQLYQTQVAQST
jgi:hypothetical protein